MRYLIILIILLTNYIQAREVFVDDNHHSFFFLGSDDLSQDAESKDKRLSRFLNLDLDTVVLMDIDSLNKIDELSGNSMLKIIDDYNLYFEMEGDCWNAVMDKHNLKIDLLDKNRQLKVKLNKNRPKIVGNYRFQYMFLSENEKVYGAIYMRDRFIGRNGGSFEVFLVIDNSLYIGSAVLKK